MNKKDYISAVDKIKAPDSLAEKISDMQDIPKKKAPLWKTVTAVAACFVAVVVAFSGIMGVSLSASKENDSYNILADGYDGAYTESSQSGSTTADDAAGAVTTDRKIIKNAYVTIRTKEYDIFITALNKKLEQYEGYIEASQEYNYETSSGRSAIMHLRIPAQSLEKFIEELSVSGTITTKQISSSDITDSYIATESRINALSTEEKTLLGLLEKAESLSDVIELQDRLSQVRSELETLRNQKKSYDSQVSYSALQLDVSEVERVVEGGDTFFGEIKEKLLNNLYDLGDFFRAFAVNLIAGIPYIVIIGIVVAVIVIIIKKKRR